MPLKRNLIRFISWPTSHPVLFGVVVSVGYRYQPHSDDTKQLCDRLEGDLPDVSFKFLIERGGLIRMRASRKSDHRDMELLLRSQTPDEIVGAFTKFFR